MSASYTPTMLDKTVVGLQYWCIIVVAIDSGRKFNQLGDKSTRTAELDTTKVLFNSVVSTPDARFCTMDITNFYLNTPLDHPEYLRIPCNLIPDEIMQEYNLHTLVKNGNVLARIDKGMYGLPQAGILANKLLKERLEPHGYCKCNHTPGLWKHHTRALMFSLVVDDFGVQYTTQIKQ
jgi:hypothetical protein